MNVNMKSIHNEFKDALLKNKDYTNGLSHIAITGNVWDDYRCGTWYKVLNELFNPISPTQYWVMQPIQVKLSPVKLSEFQIAKLEEPAA